MQDELEHPIGSILQFGGEKIPSSQFIDSAKARPQIWRGEWLLPIFRLEACLLVRRKPCRPITLDLALTLAYREAAE